MKYLLVAVAIFIFFSAARMLTASSGSARIEPTEAMERVEKRQAILVDVREPSEWNSGVAAPAYLLPLSDLRGDRKQWTRILEDLNGREVLLYCRSGNRSGVAAKILEKEGFKVGNVGGFRDWKAADLPSRAPGEPRSKASGE